MRLLFASSEVYPFSKTGGLADVLGALPAALARMGHEVVVVSPWYASLRAGPPSWIGDVDVPYDGGMTAVGVGTTELDGVRFAFVGHEEFRRDRLYGYPDDVRRFSLFTRSLPQVSERLGFLPELVHVHDWHAALLPLLLQRGEQLPAGFNRLPTVLTIHNAQYQGVAEVGEVLRWLNLPHDLELQGEAAGRLTSALGVGSRYASRVSTVSPSYASEILSDEFGYGLESTFRGLRQKPIGILNGIDTSEWDPADDKNLPAGYDARDISGKRLSKLELCERTGLDESRPLLALVSRLAEQKGIDVLLEASDYLARQGWSLFMLGTGDEALEARLRELSRDNRDIASILDYDEGLAHLVYAAADALIIPSRFEPCGLSQLIAMRYGTLPIARATGGLRDTIEHGRTGFLFSSLDPARITACAAEALSRYGSEQWSAMRDAAMTQDFSWDRSARRYQELYQSLSESR